MTLSERTLDLLASLKGVKEIIVRQSLAEVRLAAGNGEGALELLPDDDRVLRSRVEAYVQLGIEPPEAWVAHLRAEFRAEGTPIDLEWLERMDRDIGRLRRRKRRKASP